jgi:hypothetical protein
MMKPFTLVLAVVLSSSLASPAASLNDTTTRGKICGHKCRPRLVDCKMS